MIKKFLQKVFKTVSYGIFLKIHGKIEKSIDCSQDKRIKVKIINKDNNLRYRVFNIINGRLYTDRIHDTAVLLDNKIIEEPSFQLRYKGYFIWDSNIENNIVIKKGTPRKLKKLNGSVLSLLTGGGGNDNYWHWLFDVLPRLSLCNKFVDLDKIDYFLLPSLHKKFQNETLDFLNIPKSKRLSSEKFRHIKAEELIVTDHPVAITGDRSKHHNDPPEWIGQWLRDNFLKKNIISEKKNGKKIYIDRGNSTSKQSSQRYISNEDEIKKYLIKNNFILVKLHELKFIDQVNLFYNADCVVGLHGAGFVNLVFCKHGTKVIEFRSSTSGNSIQNVSKKNNLDYNPIIVESKKMGQTNIPNQQGSYQIPINILKEKLAN